MPVEHEDAMWTHFDREHPLAAADLSRFVELSGWLPVEFQDKGPQLGLSLKITLPVDFARSLKLQKRDLVGLSMLDGVARLGQLKG